jgi:hypothetical protein
VVCLLAVGGIDIIDNVYNNNPPGYAWIPMTAYGPLILLFIFIVRKFRAPISGKRKPDAGSPGEQSKAERIAIYSPVAYVVITVVIFPS